MSRPGGDGGSHRSWRTSTLSLSVALGEVQADGLVVLHGVADDQSVVRMGFRAMPELTDDLVVVGDAGNGREAVELARTKRPHVVVMDVRMPEVDGLEATRRITADPTLAAVRVLVLTTFEGDEYVFEALRAGANGLSRQRQPARVPLVRRRPPAAGRTEAWPKCCSSRTPPSPKAIVPAAPGRQRHAS